MTVTDRGSSFSGTLPTLTRPESTPPSDQFRTTFTTRVQQLHSQLDMQSAIAAPLISSAPAADLEAKRKQALLATKKEAVQYQMNAAKLPSILSEPATASALPVSLTRKENAVSIAVVEPCSQPPCAAVFGGSFLSVPFGGSFGNSSFSSPFTGR